MRNPYAFDDDAEDVNQNIKLLREEVTEVRNGGIKTEHQLKNLAAEVRGLGEQEGARDRRRFLHSGVAYGLFVLLVAGGAFLVIHARTGEQEAQRALFAQKQAAYQEEIGELRTQLGRWKQIERTMLEFESLVKTGNKERAVEAFADLKNVRFSGLLEDLISRFRREVAREKYDTALTSYRKGSFDRADALFTKSLEFEQKPPYLGSLLHHHGMTMLRLKSFARAAKLLREALDYNHGSKELAELRYHLAYAHDRLGEKRTARDLYYRFSQRHSKHHFAPRAKRRYESLKKKK